MFPLRFSRNKRFLLAPISYADFVEAVNAMAELLKEERSAVTAKILTCEDKMTYNYSNVTVGGDEVDQALKKRREYMLGAFTEEVWARAYKAEAYFKDKTDSAPFMVVVGCDKFAEPRRLMYYGQSTGETIRRKILESFGVSNLSYTIGDGHSRRISTFNLEVGERVTGITLRP